MADDVARFGVELEIAKLRRDVTAGMRQLDKLDKQADKTSRGVKNIGVSARGLATAFAAVAAAGVGLGFVGKQLFDLGATAFETQSKFDTVFGDSAAAVEEFGKTFGRMAGLSQVATQEVLATTGAIVQGMGFSREASAKFSQSIITLAGDLASFNNIPTADTARAIQAALTGERESLKRLGVVILETDVQKRALLDTGKENAKQLTQQEKATATLALITARAGVAVGDLARTQDSAANRAKQLRARFDDLINQFAKDLLPVLQSLIEPLDQLIGRAEKWASALAVGIVTFSDLVGMTNAAARFEGVAIADLPPDQLAGRVKRLQTEIGGQQAAAQKLTADLFDEGDASKQIELIEKRQEIRDELVGLIASLVDAETQLRAYTDTIKQADAAQREETQAQAVKDKKLGKAAALARTEGFAAFTGGLESPGFQASPLPISAAGQRGRMLMADAEAQFEGLMNQTDEWFKANLEGIEAKTKAEELAAFRTKKAWEQAGVGAILAAGRTLEAVLRGQGGAGGFISALGGIAGGLLMAAQGINPLIGASVIAGTGIIGAAFSSGSEIDPAPVRVVSFGPEALDQQRGSGGPENITIQIIRSDTGLLEAEFELKRATSRDAFIRIPVGAGISG